MASDNKDAASCLNDPNFAIICAFLQKFAIKLNVEHPNFHDLQLMIENTDEGKWENIVVLSLEYGCGVLFCIYAYIELYDMTFIYMVCCYIMMM